MILRAVGRSVPVARGGGTGRLPWPPRRRGRLVGKLLALPALLWLVSACHLMRPVGPGPAEQVSYDETLRRMARQGKFSLAIERTGPDFADDAGDELLRTLHRGLLEHYAGRYSASNATLQRAEVLAEERYTRSISRALLSFITNDRALAWIPNRTERLMVNYFGALNYLAMNDLEGAAVEVRRLSYLLERTEELELDRAERRLRTALRYFAGVAFEAAGERNDAAVAYRHVWPATSPAPAGAPDATSDSAAESSPIASLVPADWEHLVEAGIPRRDEYGEVVVVVESGFVAHRVERTRELRLLPGEVDALDGSASDAQYGVASCVAARGFSDVLASLGSAKTRSERWLPDAQGSCAAHPAAKSEARKEQEGAGPEEPLEIRIAWPAMERSGPPTLRADVAATLLRSAASTEATASRTALDPGTEVPGAEPRATEAAAAPPVQGARGAGPGARVSSGMNADLSGAVIEEYEDGLAFVLAKTIARSASKYALAHEIEKELAGEDEVLGKIAWFTAGAAVALFERADTRSWHLLPAELAIARLRLPAGKHAVTLEVVDDLGGPRLLELGEVTVRPGGVHVVSTRVWP